MIGYAAEGGRATGSAFGSGEETDYNRSKGNAMEISVESLPQGLWEYGAALPAADYVADIIHVKDGMRIALQLRVTRMGDEVLVEGDLDVAGSLQCARCLEEFPYDFRGSFKTLYAPERRAIATRWNEVENVEFYTGSAIDITSDIRDCVLAAIPMKPLCKPECKGLCRFCGQNLNESACDCRERRAAASSGLLGEFFKKKRS